jgi:formate hydrogenlyase subunit 4
MKVLIYCIGYFIFFGVLPFFFAGLIEKVKAFCSGRKGKPVWQPWYDFRKLMQKERVVSQTTSNIFQMTPLLTLAAIITAGLLIPVLGMNSPLSFSGDLVVFAYLLALARFFGILSALDTGSSFEGMGAAREINYGLLAEPSLFMLFGTLLLFTGDYSLHSFLFGKIGLNPGLPIVVGGVLVLLIMTLVEGCRLPFDDPNTHLELTMIHEVMVLDNSGPDLAVYSYSSYLKMTLFANLIACLILGRVNSSAPAILATLTIVVLVAITIGIIESIMARLRLQKTPQLLLNSFGLGLILFIFFMLN